MINRFKDYLNYKEQHRALNGTVHGSLYRRSLWYFLMHDSEQRAKIEAEEVEMLESIIQMHR